MLVTTSISPSLTRLRRFARYFRFAAVVALGFLVLLCMYIGSAGLMIWLERRGWIAPQIASTLEQGFFDPLYMYINSQGVGAGLIQQFLRSCGKNF